MGDNDRQQLPPLPGQTKPQVTCLARPTGAKGEPPDQRQRSGRPRGRCQAQPAKLPAAGVPGTGASCFEGSLGPPTCSPDQRGFPQGHQTPLPGRSPEVHFQEVAQTPARCWPGKRLDRRPLPQPKFPALTFQIPALQSAPKHRPSLAAEPTPPKQILVPPSENWGAWQRPPQLGHLGSGRRLHTAPGRTRALGTPHAFTAWLWTPCLPLLVPSPHSPRLQWSSSVSAPGQHGDPLGSKGETVVSPQAWPLPHLSSAPHLGGRGTAHGTPAGLCHPGAGEPQLQPPPPRPHSPSLRHWPPSP